MTAIAGITQTNLQQQDFEKKIRELSEKLSGMKEEKYKLWEKLKRLKEDDTMNQKISSLADQNRKHEETIRFLEASLETLLKELENEKKAKDLLRIDLEKKISTISTEKTILAKQFEALTKEFEAVVNENKDLKRRLDTLTGDVKILMEEREKLECKNTRLALGQVAWLLENEISKYVLPKVNMGKSNILYSMERYFVRKNISGEKRETAKKRWEDLKEKLNWDEEDHKSALKILKDLRLDDAHPKNVDLEVARKQLNEGNYVAETEKQACEEVIDMLIAARKLNNTTE